MSHEEFTAPIARMAWETKYRHRGAGGVAERSVAESWDRVAAALAAAEADAGLWRGRFREILAGFRFLPGGRIPAGAGTPRRVRLFMPCHGDDRVTDFACDLRRPGHPGNRCRGTS